MKLSSATLFIGYMLANVLALPDADANHEESPTTPLDAQPVPNRMMVDASSDNPSNGLILVKGGFGKINISSIASAQAAGISVLQALPGYSGSETFVPQNSDPLHMRYGQQVHGMDVEGASLYVHVDKFGTVIGVNGELVDGTSVPSEPTIDAGTAIEAALKESRVPAEEYDNCSPPTLTVVRGLKDGKAYLAWTCTVRYDIVGEDGYLKPFNDQIFARATGDTPGLIQIYPKIYGARSVETRNCNESRKRCVTAFTSPNPISVPTDLPIQFAHNYAISVYDYYFQKHGRDSIDGVGMTLVSNVHYDKELSNAYWDKDQMWYGDGDGIVFRPLSLGGDVVAHELTHGVTERSSNLIYENESGALNEAISDIFGALFDSFMGKIDVNIWLCGEDIVLPGLGADALRFMCDPERDRTASSGIFYSRDYYPDRFPSTATPTDENDSGGVHLNSGIANLAACLMVKGGKHPRGKTTVDVPAIVGGYDALGSIFYKANTACLTPSSNFAAARFCTADVHGGSNKANVNLAWDAVGVPIVTDPVTSTPTMMPTSKAGKKKALFE